MAKCFNCSHWIMCRKTIYGDGSEIVVPIAAMGKGNCQELGIDTTPDFGCQSHRHGEEHAIVTHKGGAPWENFEYKPCPDCDGRGSTPEAGMCYRCYGTARVRFYDDGYIGEERTRLHPKEREALQCMEPPNQSPLDLSLPNPEAAQIKPKSDPFAAQATQ